MFAGWGRGALGALSAGGNKLGSVAMSANSPPTSLYDDIYINPSAPLDDSDDMHTILGPVCQHLQLTGNVTVIGNHYIHCNFGDFNAFSKALNVQKIGFMLCVGTRLNSIIKLVSFTHRDMLPVLCKTSYSSQTLPLL